MGPRRPLGRQGRRAPGDRGSDRAGQGVGRREKKRRRPSPCPLPQAGEGTGRRRADAPFLPLAGEGRDEGLPSLLRATGRFADRVPKEAPLSSPARSPVRCAFSSSPPPP